MSYYTRRELCAPEEDYFSIDDILATSERVPCRFEVPAHKLGFLDPSSENTDIKAGTKLELPLWITQSLYSRRIVTTDLPKVYREGYREILSADADVVDLHKMGPYFYHFGLYLLKFQHQDSEDVVKMLNETFRQRFRRLMDISQNSLDEDVSSLTARLDQTELVLFKVGQKSLHDLKIWRERKVQKIETANLVMNYKKRRRTVLADSQSQPDPSARFGY